MSLETAPVQAKPKRRRRSFTEEFKRDLVAQTLEPEASVSSVALANGINTNQLFAWRRQLLGSGEPQRTALLPVHLDLTGVAAIPTPVSSSPASLEGHIEITIGTATIRLHGQVNADALGAVLQCLLR